MSQFPSTPVPMPYASPNVSGDVSGDANSTAVAIAELRPYAFPEATRGPVDAMMIDAIRASVGPFVPAPWRLPVPSVAPGESSVPPQMASVAPIDSTVTVEPTAASESDALPWIDSFLDSSDAPEPLADPAPVRFAVPVPPTSIFAADVEPADETVDEAPAMFAPIPVEVPTEAPVVDVPLAATGDVSSIDSAIGDVPMGDAPMTDAALSDDVVADEWPMAEAGAMMEALAAELSPEPTDTPPVNETDLARMEPQSLAAPLMEPMAAWSDDDIMDIMPIRPSDAPSPTNEHWAVQARREADGSSGTEAAAAVLEGLARRVRDGELVLPGYSAEMGDAATLAAALAALLGARR